MKNNNENKIAITPALSSVWSYEHTCYRAKLDDGTVIEQIEGNEEVEFVLRPEGSGLFLSHAQPFNAHAQRAKRVGATQSIDVSQYC